ncbi:OmpA family protein [Bacteroides sp. An322]|uniref:OmpA family protein n=1 Tax=Bacteroides sp. An322 TaxID=1965632 RepID=UPI000B387D55|nr:OmpA family protein [Bacteroides sp. An322]OUO20569.1 cell envelope biogenesis protein OmpA [Bacteroides sp. An322]
MNKKVFMAAALVLAAGSVCAQTEPVAQSTEVVEESTDNVEINSFWSNWFISAGGGAQIYFGDHDRQASFGDRLSGALDIAVGKWFSPEIGVRLMYSGLSAKGATQKGHLAHSTGVDVPGKGGNGYWLEKSKFNFFNFQIDAMFNASNIIWGYNEKRVYNLSPYVGLGVMRVSDKPAETAIAGHFGLLNSFRLTSCLDLNLDIRGTLVNDDFDGEPGGRKGEGLLTATLGLTYKFSPRGWNRGKNVIRTVYNTAEIKAMQEKLRQMSEENARLQEAIANGNKEEAQTIVKQIASSNLVVFPIGKSTLSNEARVNLGMLAEVIKKGDPHSVYTITGYADEGTGSEELNRELSKERADAVYDCLVKEFGISQSQLRIDYKGGVDNMFYNDPRLSRAVITQESN